MRLEHCIRRWLGLSWHYVRKAEEVDGRLPRCGHCGKPVHRTKGHTRPREWRDLKMRHLPLVIACTPRRVVEWGLAQRRKRPLRILGIDEVSRKKGHKYLTLVYDLERGEWVWVGKPFPPEALHGLRPDDP